MRLTATRCAALLLIPLAIFGGSGCGGGGVQLTNPTRIKGTLDENDSRFSDGSLSDFYVATARRSGRAQIEMTSEAFDSYLIVSAENSEGEVENVIEDNDSGDGQNARVIFDVKNGDTYFIAAIDDSAALAPGSYTVTFSDIFKNVKVNPDSTPRSRGGRR